MLKAGSAMDAIFLFRLGLRGTFEGRPGRKLAAAGPPERRAGMDHRLRGYRVWDGVVYWLAVRFARAGAMGDGEACDGAAAHGGDVPSHRANHAGVTRA